MSGLRVAVVGATGVVGRTMLQVLAQRRFPVASLRALATARTAGRKVLFQGEEIPVEDVEKSSFEGLDLCLFAGSEVASSVHVPRALQAGCLCVDNASTFRMNPDVPLVVPEVNPHALDGGARLVANPNCSTIQMVVVLAPLARRSGLRRVVVSTYQSVSGAGKEGMEELERQVGEMTGSREPTASLFPHPILHNVIPHDSPYGPDGLNEEERKMIQETRKILELPDLPVTATCVRVPVPVGHAEALNVETREPLSPEEAREILAQSPGIRILDEPARGIYPTPRQAAGQDEVLVGRIRRDPSCPRGLDLWIAADNLRKGAATNAVQIAEELVRRGRVTVA